MAYIRLDANRREGNRLLRESATYGEIGKAEKKNPYTRGGRWEEELGKKANTENRIT